MNFNYSDITGSIPDELKPSIDLINSPLHCGLLTPYQEAFSENGVLVLHDFVTDDLIDSYCRLWERENSKRPGGWSSCTPYMQHDEIKNLGLFPALSEVLHELMEQQMGMHLNLTGWVSTERNFHSDFYLNPPHVGGFYLAVWIALENVHPDAGPFEYVPGSHRWPVMQRELLFKHIPKSMQTDHRWPSLTQDAVSAACEEEILKRSAVRKRFLGQRGDVLIWHSNLLHRGTTPNNKKLLRKAFIAHYSSLNHRQDMPAAVRWREGGYYFPIKESTEVR